MKKSFSKNQRLALCVGILCSGAFVSAMQRGWDDPNNDFSLLSQMFQNLPPKPPTPPTPPPTRPTNKNTTTQKQKFVSLFCKLKPQEIRAITKDIYVEIEKYRPRVTIQNMINVFKQHGITLPELNKNNKARFSEIITKVFSLYAFRELVKYSQKELEQHDTELIKIITAFGSRCNNCCDPMELCVTINDTIKTMPLFKKKPVLKVSSRREVYLSFAPRQMQKLLERLDLNLTIQLGYDLPGQNGNVGGDISPRKKQRTENFVLVGVVGGGRVGINELVHQENEFENLDQEAMKKVFKIK